MPHPDDGQLHAYLDRQLAYRDAEARATLEAHVEKCPACAERLAEARDLSARSAEIMTAGDALETAPPPFETIVSRASRRRQPIRMTTLRNLGWAASIVIAVGIGWYARSTRIEPGVSGGVPPSPVPSVQARRAEPAASAEAVAPPAIMPEPEAPTAGVASQPPAPSPETMSASPRPNAGAPVRNDEPSTLAQTRAFDSLGSADQRVARGASEDERRANVALRAEAVAAPLPTDWTMTTDTEAERLLGGPLLVVPELTIADVASWQPSPGDAPIVRVRQLLPGGDTLVLLETTRPIAPESDRRAREQASGAGAPLELADTAESSATVVRDYAVVTGRAAISSAELQAWLARVQPRVNPIRR